MRPSYVIQLAVAFPLLIITIVLLALNWWIAAVAVAIVFLATSFWARKADRDRVADEAIAAKAQHDAANLDEPRLET